MPKLNIEKVNRKFTHTYLLGYVVGIEYNGTEWLLDKLKKPLGYDENAHIYKTPQDVSKLKVMNCQAYCREYFGISQGKSEAFEKRGGKLISIT